MKKFCTFLLMTAVAATFAACGGAAENKPANLANANTAKPAPAAPTTDALLDMEKKAQEAYAKGDSAYFEGMLSDKMTMSMGKDRMNKAGVVEFIKKNGKCELTDGVKLSDPQMSKIDNDTYAFSYRNDSAGKCLENGKMVDQKPARAASVWVRNGDKWQAAWHGETLIVEPKKEEAKKDDAKKDEAKKDDAKADVAKKDDVKADVAKKDEAKADVAKKDETKADVAKKDEAKADVTKKEAPKKDDKMAANSAPAEAPKADANTEALVKIHTSGWEAFKAKDAKKFEEILSSNMAFVDPVGGWISGKANVIKQWTETMKCDGITKVSVTDGFASAISPTIELLNVKGSSDGTCDGQKNGPLWQTAVYVKEGNDWKLAFMFETVAK